MKLIDRIRSLFSSPPTVDNPSTGTLMSRGGGEEAGPIDEARDPAQETADYGVEDGGDEAQDRDQMPILGQPH